MSKGFTKIIFDRLELFIFLQTNVFFADT
jgi:hypothetical protein